MDINVEYDWPINQHQLNHRVSKVDVTPSDWADAWPRMRFPVGLHLPVSHFQTKNLVESFAQAAIQILDLTNKVIILGGIGNKTSNKISLKVVRVAAGNGIAKVYTGVGGVMSRPAMSSLCSKYGCWGFLIHATHNLVPSYDEEMLGIDLIDTDGGPVGPDKMERILASFQRVCAYFAIPTISYSHVKKGHKLFIVEKRTFTVDVVDTVAEYAHYARTMFDFESISNLLAGVKYIRPFRIEIHCGGGAGGPYAQHVFEEELGVGGGCVVNWRPTDACKTFHPAQVGKTAFDQEMKSKSCNIDLGACLSADGSRCVVYGSRGFCVPSGEALVALAANFQACPYLQSHRFLGIGRSFLTSSSADDVRQKELINVTKTPGRWAYFKRQVAAGRVSLWEDESYGIGSAPNRSGDGIWTILAWLTLVIQFYKPVQNIVIDRWNSTGRHFVTHYEYHSLPKNTLNDVIRTLQYQTFLLPNFLNSTLDFDGKTYKILSAGNFPYCFRGGVELLYEDAILRIELEPKSLIMFSTVTAGDSGTLRISVDVFLNNTEFRYPTNKVSVTKNHFDYATQISHLKQKTGKSSPDLVY